MNAIDYIKEENEVLSVVKLSGTGNSISNNVDMPTDRDWHFKFTQTDLAWIFMEQYLGQLDASSVTIAILDSGVNTNHADLDDTTLLGWNVPDNNPNTLTIDGPIGGPYTLDQHGTWVASIAGAEHGNIDDSISSVDLNGIPFTRTVDENNIVNHYINDYGNWDGGTKGVANGVNILPIKTKRAFDFGSTVPNILSGIDYAVSQGSDIINLSIGIVDGYLFTQASDPNGSDLGFYDKFSQYPNTIFVLAAGNYYDNLDASYLDYYGNTSNPTELRRIKELDNVVVVGGYDESLDMWKIMDSQNVNVIGGSAYGPNTVDLAAPSVNIIGAADSYIDLINTPSGSYFGLGAIDMTVGSGTSAAAPMVSGALALMQTRFS